MLMSAQKVMSPPSTQGRGGGIWELNTKIILG